MLNITADSRKIKKGDIFVAIKGIEHDGHEFIQDAILNGASKIIAQYGTYNVPYEIVEDSREYLIEYLKEHYKPKLKNICFIGITGTNGKTTTAFWIYKALRHLGVKSAYIGTIGFYLEDKVCSLSNTCPDIWNTYDFFMQAEKEGCKYIIQEISSHALINKRVEGYEFDYIIFTNLTQDHLDFHHTMDNYAMAKQKLFRKLKTGGKAIVNIDDSYKNYFLLEENHNITYGFGLSDYRVLNYNMTSKKTTFTYSNKNDDSTIEMNIVGKYNIYNMMATMSLLREEGFSKEGIEAVIPLLEAPSGRMESISYKKSTIIIDYAHTPDSVEKVITTVKDFCKGNVYVVFGCTGDRDRTKRSIMFSLVTNLCKRAIITNDDPHNEDPKQIVSDMIKGTLKHNYEICLDREKAIQKGMEWLKENDTLLILGKGHEEVMIIKDKHIPFSDQRVVYSYMNKLK